MSIDVKREIHRSGKLFPLLSCDSCLAQDTGQQFATNITSVGIRYSQSHIAFAHEVVFTALVRPIESQGTQAPNQVPSRYGAKRRHQAAISFFTVSSTPSILGSVRFL